MRKIYLGLIMIVFICLSLNSVSAASQEEEISKFFESMKEGLVFLEYPSSSYNFNPVVYLIPESDKLTEVQYEQLSPNLQAKLVKTSIRSIWSFQAKNFWTGKSSLFYLGCEGGRADGGMTIFDEEHYYKDGIRVNPKSSQYYWKYLITLKKPKQAPLELLAYHLEVMPDYDRNTTIVSGALILRNNTSKKISAFGGNVDFYSKLGTKLSERMNYEIQDNILLPEGQVMLVRLNMNFPNNCRIISPSITDILFDDNTTWKTN